MLKFAFRQHRGLFLAGALLAIVPTAAGAQTVTPISDSIRALGHTLRAQSTSVTQSGKVSGRHTMRAVLIGTGIGLAFGAWVDYNRQEGFLRKGELARWTLGFGALGAGIGFLVPRY
jgi:hypothetical protein